jgi:hypothetical protein
MAFSIPAFDTLHYVKKLEAAGMDPKQAEAQVEFQAEVLSSLVKEKVATKEDLDKISTELRHEINLVKWMLGVLITGVAAIVVKTFLH